MIASIALAIVLPFFVHATGMSPRVLLPMHFPVLLAGTVLRPWQAAIVGIFAPALSMGISGMPTPDQAMRMMPELATYGFATSMMLRLVPVLPVGARETRRLAAIGLALIIAMILGRLAYIAVAGMQTVFQPLAYYYQILIVPAIAGLIVQLLLIPPIAVKLHKALNRG